MCLGTNLSPEAELLLCCARVVLPDAERERVMRLVQSNLDWNLVMQLAARHRLLPLLYRHVDALPSGTVPREIRIDLWHIHARTTRHNQVLTDELLKILQVLESHGIPAVPYKGPVLAVAVYGDVGLRPFCDLDILVRPQDLLLARDLLLTRGYRPVPALQPAQEASFLRAKKYHHICLAHQESKITVELHWKTGRDGPAFTATDDWLWARLVTVKLGEAGVRHFAAEELLLLLCLHGTAHQWESLGWLVDVAEVIRQHPQLDWARLMVAAAKVTGQRRLALGLYLAHHLLDAPLPDPIRGRIAAEPRVKTLAGEVSERLFQPTLPELSRFEVMAFRLKLLESCSQRIRVMLGAVNPTLIEWGHWPLPKYLSFLYYPLRLGRLLIEDGMGFLARHLNGRRGRL
jgi:hypothetical protein